MDMGFNQNDHLFPAQSMDLPPLPPSASQDWLITPQLMGIGDFNGFNFPELPQHPYTSTNPQPQQLLQVNQLAPPSLGFPYFSSTDHLSLEFSQFLSSELERQTAEMEAFLQIENQRLNAVLWEQTRQRGVLLEQYALNVVSLLQKKENELVLAKQTNMDIEERKLRTDAEAKAWKKLAVEKEGIVADLTRKMRKLCERIQMMNNGASDANSSCGGGGENSWDKSKNCKVCQAQLSCVVLFPCKHLCCCKSCEAIVNFCPVCKSSKKKSMEIFFG